jgi:uncharacterized membrane-anchored protein YhcB (DUF1043 family)
MSFVIGFLGALCGLVVGIIVGIVLIALGIPPMPEDG